MKLQESHTPSFYGYKSKVAKNIERSLRNNSLTSAQGESIYTLLKKKIAPDRLCGVGMHASVYKIDDYYVVKVPSKVDYNEKVICKEGVIKPSFNNLKTYFGEVLFKLKNFYILKNVSSKNPHIPVGIPLKNYINLTFYDIHKPENYNKLLDTYNKSILPLVSSLPQKSYDAVARDCSLLNKMSNHKFSYFFDYENPNNFVIVGNKIRVIDTIYKSSPDRLMNTISSLLEVFLNNMGYQLSAKFSKDLVSYRRDIFKKVILAGIKQGLPVEPSGNHPFSFKKALKLTDLSNIDDDSFIVSLNNLLNIRDKDKRVAITQEFLNKLFKNAAS